MAGNVGRLDAVIRGSLAVVLFVAAAAVTDHIIISLGVLLCGLVIGVTALTRDCPIYRRLGIDTSKLGIHPRHR